MVVVLGEGHRVRANAPLGNTKIRGIFWAGDDRLHVVNSATETLGPEFTQDKAELFGAFVLPLQGQKPFMVFKSSQHLALAIFGNYGARQIGGKWRGFFGGVEFERDPAGGFRFDHGRPALFSVDLLRNSPDQIAHAAPEGHWRDWLIDGEGLVAAMIDIRSETGGWKITNARGTKLASGIDRSGDVSLVCLGRDGTSVIYSVEDAEGQRRWFEVPLAGGSPQEILAEVDVKRLYEAALCRPRQRQDARLPGKRVPAQTRDVRSGQAKRHAAHLQGFPQSARRGHGLDTQLYAPAGQNQRKP